MRVLLFLAAVAALLVPAASAGGLPHPPPAPESPAPAAAAATSSPTPGELPPAELTVTATVSAERYIPPDPAPEGPEAGASYSECMEVWQDDSLCSGGEPAEPAPNPGGGEGIPSIEEQIAQCIAQTGLPQECEDKIRHGIP